MIRELHISGFKSIYDQTFSLGRLNCFIGANGVGKSNVLEAIGLLGAAANGVVDDESLLRRGVRPGLPRLYKSSFAEDRTPPHITCEARSEDASYRIALLNPLDDPEPAWTYRSESLIEGAEIIVSRGTRTSQNLNPQAGLASLRLVELAPDSPAASLMQTLQQYAIYCPNTPTLRGTIPDPQTRPPVGLNGGLLAEGFSQLLRHLEGSEQGDEALSQVLELIDWVQDIQATSQGGSLLSAKVPRTKWMLKFTDRYMAASRNELTAYDASEGALYVIFTALLCLSPQAPRLLAIDNLDQALNPRLGARLAARLEGWLAGHAPDRQLLFTAHNPAVLDGLNLDHPEVRLFSVERNSQGHTSIRRIEVTEELLRLHAQYPLSRLWMMGHLGAVPHV
jgi:hypothetical protein